MADWLRQHRKGLVIALAMVLVLAAAYFLAESPKAPTGEEASSGQPSVSRQSRSSSRIASAEASSGLTESRMSSSEPQSSELPSNSAGVLPESSSDDGRLSFSSGSAYSSREMTSPAEPSAVPSPEAPVEPSADTDETTSQPSESEAPVKVSSQPAHTAASEASSSSAAAPGEESTQPSRVSREEDPSPSPQNRCTVSISCSLLLDNMEQLRKNKRGIVPKDGVILSSCEADFEEGESVFEVTRRVCQEKGIPFEFTLAPVYHTAYIEGIGNLYEFDCGSGSGWVYAVNRELPSVGCSDWKLHSGDRVEWFYTCALGHDVEEMLRHQSDEEPGSLGPAADPAVSDSLWVCLAGLAPKGWEKEPGNLALNAIHRSLLKGGGP